MQESMKNQQSMFGNQSFASYSRVVPPPANANVTMDGSKQMNSYHNHQNMNSSESCSFNFPQPRNISSCSLNNFHQFNSSVIRFFFFIFFSFKQPHCPSLTHWHTDFYSQFFWTKLKFCHKIFLDTSRKYFGVVHSIQSSEK